MNRTEKAEFVDRLSEHFRSNPHLILTQFSGLTVNQANTLRQKVSEAGGSMQVIKNRLAKRAALRLLFLRQLSGSPRRLRKL